GVISGSGSLSIPGGAGQLILNNANTYSGGTNLGGGTVIATNSSTLSGNTIVSGSLGTGALNLTGGVIEASGTALQAGVAAATFPNPITLQNAAVTFGGLSGTTLTFSGNVLVQGNTNTLTVSHAGMPTAAGLITPGVMFTGVVSGSGALTLVNGSSGGDQFTG